MQNAEQARQFWLRRAEYFDSEAKIALVHCDDAKAFQIYSDGADNAREIAEHWKRSIIGGK